MFGMVIVHRSHILAVHRCTSGNSAGHNAESWGNVGFLQKGTKIVRRVCTPFVIYRFLLFVFLLERNFVLACFWSICSGQNHSGDAAFEDRLMEVDQQPDGDIQQFHVAEELRFAGRMQNLDSS